MSIPTSKKATRRRGIPANLYGTAPRYRGRHTMTDSIAHRLTGVQTPDLPREEIRYTEDQAWQRGLITLEGMSILSGIPTGTWSGWRQYLDNFPEWVAVQHQDGKMGKPWLYDARELAEWFKENSQNGRVLRRTSRQNQRL